MFCPTILEIFNIFRIFVQKLHACSGASGRTIAPVVARRAAQITTVTIVAIVARGWALVAIIALHSWCTHMGSARVIPHTTLSAALPAATKTWLETRSDIYGRLQRSRTMGHARIPQLFRPQALQEVHYLRVFTLVTQSCLVT